MKAFKFYRRYWAAIGGGLFVALAFFIGLWGQKLPDLRRFMVLMFMTLKSWYSPGCLSACTVMPIMGVWFLVYLAGNYTFPSYYWWAPICVFPVVAFLTILLPILSFRRRDTPYGFASHQADEFAVRHGIASLFRNTK